MTVGTVVVVFEKQVDYRLMLLFQASDVEAGRATVLAKEALDGFGPVRSVTMQEWLYQQEVHSSLTRLGDDSFDKYRRRFV